MMIGMALGYVGYILDILIERSEGEIGSGVFFSPDKRQEKLLIFDGGRAY
jgi:hypothetical protein